VTALRWRDIDLANGRISVGDSKTEAGIRLVDILPALRDELTGHRHAAATARPDDLVFPTSSGSRRDKDNARERVIRPVVAAADELLARRGHGPLPDGVTAHKLRHTFASILYVRGEDPAYVMAQRDTPIPASRSASTHTRCAATRATKSGSEPSSRAVIGHQWALAPLQSRSRPRRIKTPERQSPRKSGTLDDGRGGFRTCDLSRVKHGVRGPSTRRNACK
jgi:hypothetical protein